MQLGPNDRRSLILCALFLTVVFGYLYGLEPLLNAYDAASAEITEVEAKVDTWNRERGRLGFRRRLSDLVDEALDEWLLARQLDLPPGQRLTRTMADLQSIASVTGITLSDVRPLATTTDPRSLFDEIAYAITFTGKEDQVWHAIYLIENAPALQHVTQADLSPKADLISVRLSVVRRFVTAVPEADKADKDAEASPATAPAPSRQYAIAALPSLESGALFIAHDKGFLDSPTTKYKLILTVSGIVGNWLLGEEEIDAVALNGAAFLLDPYVPATWTPEYTLCESRLPMGVLTARGGGIERGADLRGKRVAYDTRNHQGLFLIRRLVGDGLAHGDIVPVLHLAQGERIPAIKAGVLDAAVLRQPRLDQQSTGDELRVLFQETPSFPFDTYLLAIRARERTAEEKRDVLLLMQAILKAQRFWRENPAAGNRIVGRYLLVEPRRIETWRAHMTLFEPGENRRRLLRWKAAVDDAATGTRLRDLLEAWGEGEVVIDPGRRVTGAPLSELIATEGEGHE